jgi:prefoldin beta subunit
MASEELKSASGKIYKAIGNLLIETSTAAAKKDLSEKIESFEVRAGSLGKQEDKLRAKSEELRAMLEKALASSQRGAAEASG